MGKYDIRYIHLDSADRLAGENVNNYTYRLGPAQYNISLDKCKKIEIVSIEVPYSFYVVKNTVTANNIISFDDSGATDTATIVPGQYTAAQLAVEIKTRMDAASSLPQVYTVAYSNVTMMFTISSVANFQLLFASVANQLANIIGFTLTDLAGANTYTSQGVASLNGPNYLLVKSKVTGYFRVWLIGA
jgi:hypothetical protein